MPARILVVDDVEINVRLLEAKLASEYYTVISAVDGPTGLAMAQAEHPDLVLLDVMMPGMDGFEVCRRLKADTATADIPVVMVTALSDVADRVRGLEAGADDFLTKPLNDTALFARVRSLVRLRRMTEEWRLREEVCGYLAPLAEPRPVGVEDRGPARILLVETQPRRAGRVAEMLASIAGQVVHVDSVQRLEAALDSGIELIIADMSEGRDALRLISRLRVAEATRGLPVLLIAETSDLPQLATALDLGANDYILRPLDRNELIARARTQIRRKRIQDRLRENYQRSLSLALTDGLTGLYNRSYLLAHLERLLRRAVDGADPVSVLMFDIDGFKQVNDGYGHAAGDAVLREVALRATRNLRSLDLIARYGGDEFVVVMPETSLTVALSVAERLRQTIAGAPILAPQPPQPIEATVSIGAAAATAGDTAATLLHHADQALYAAKNGGRNRVVGWEADGTPPT